MKIENWKWQNIKESEELSPQVCRVMLEDGKDAKCKEKQAQIRPQMDESQFGPLPLFVNQRPSN